MWKLKVYFSDGSEAEEEYDTEEEAEQSKDEWYEGWSAGAEVLALANEDYSDADIEDIEIWEED